MSLLEVHDITKRDARGFELQKMSFSLESNSKLAISGETGSGKSTLLKIMAGLVNPDSGNIFFDGERLKRVPEEKLIPGHNGIAYLSQHFELPNHLRIEQVLTYATELSTEKAFHIFRICKIDQFLKRKTNELSGGERQRVALAKLLVGSPRLLLLDEPFSNLDPSLKSLLKGVIEDLASELNITCVLVSHDPADVLSWADEVLILQNGAVIQKDKTESVYNQPVNEYVAGLFGFYNMIAAEEGRRSMVRPEWITVHPTFPEQTARVVQKKFFGSFYDVVLETEERQFLARIFNDQIDIGDVVGYRIDKSWAF